MTREEAIRKLQKQKAEYLEEWVDFSGVAEAYDMAIEALQSTMNQERVNHESTNDLISRADAIEAMEARIKWFNGDAIEDRCKRDAFIQALDIITELPSAEAVHKPDYSYEANMVKRLRQAEAEPTVIRSRTLMPTKDFKEWAKRVREENPNVIVIPCDAEVALDEAVKAVQDCRNCKYGSYNDHWGTWFCNHECECSNWDLWESAEAVQLKQTDTLIIADALRYLAQDEERHLSDRTRADALREQILKYGASMCHSAEAVQGEWIHNEARIYTCSKCGTRHSFISVKPSNYCPNCGAMMTPYKGCDSE